ncbi:response regulator [candidate division KSB1 bacterium]|nr:response regulator [candidate division KSB1 bacterium]NIR68612.1 response regulator [candidate division KSB1 bacterium]NIS24116.1 response regulator [candidate division KSB1 bacterium]NIT71033.1 response regulator [candidate division KSB1 bacterium]NIU24735.1 response regulator [candidate division KSB1 bacterium]
MSDKILIVDGEEQLRSRCKVELQALGYDVIAVGDAKGALQTVEQEPVDLVVLDLVLPDEAGFEHLQKLVSAQRNVKVVINTAYPSYKADFNSWIADAFLTKSTDLTELKDTIGSVLRSN